MRTEISSRCELWDREEWGADPEHPRLGHVVPRSARDEVILHHTVMIDSNDDSPNVWEEDLEVKRKMRRLQTIRPDLGNDVPYNFVAFLRPDETVTICEGRGEDRSGAHTHGHNSRGIAISFAGNFELPAPIDLAIQPLNDFLFWLKYAASSTSGNFEPMNNLGLSKPEDRWVWIHSDFKATACPGNAIRDAAPLFNFDGTTLPDPASEADMLVLHNVTLLIPGGFIDRIRAVINGSVFIEKQEIPFPVAYRKRQQDRDPALTKLDVASRPPGS